MRILNAAKAVALGWAAVAAATSTVYADVGELELSLPLIWFSGGSVEFDATTGQLVVLAEPTTAQFDEDLPIGPVGETFNPPDKFIAIEIFVGPTGGLASGSQADDLIVQGAVDTDGDGVPDFGGTLLTGEAIDFRFVDGSMGGPGQTETDYFRFRFRTVRGSIDELFHGEVGVMVESANSDFEDWITSFTGEAEGVLGTSARLGGCCFPDGSCRDLTPFECNSLAGAFQGLGVLCADTVCPSLGACCFVDGSCAHATDADCGARGGFFQGYDQDCESAGCEPLLSVMIELLTPASGPRPLAVGFRAVPGGDTVTLYEWDFDGDGTFDVSGAEAMEVTHVYDEEGEFDALVRVTGSTGATATDTVLITVTEGLVANIIANPMEGTRPLQVTFTPDASSSGPSIEGFRWDFDGDGVFDTPYRPRPDPISYTYTVAAVYTVVLEIIDENGLTAQGTKDITVRNPLPVASVMLSPSNGPVPLEVTFSVTASSENGPIVEVSIDPADGSDPIVLPGPGDAVHTYLDAGEYNATVTVTDAAGETITIDSPLVNVFVGEEGSPTAVASGNPTSGDAPLDVFFSADGSSDPGGTIVLYEWDFDFDGQTFNPDFASPDTGDTNHVYTNAGTHFPALRVTDNDGLTGLDALGVNVNLTADIVILDDTFNPHLGEQTTIETTISAGTTVRVRVRDRAGTIVRTLFDGARDQGTYDDMWDGTNDAGAMLNDADYYGILEYEIDGVTFVIPGPSGGSFGFVSNTQNVSNGGSIDPWADQFWELTFNTERVGGPADVTVWITPFRNGSENITATPLLNEPFGRGVYPTAWDGITDLGKYVPPRGMRLGSGGDYLFSAQGFRLANNVMVVEGGRPLITAPSADPNIYDPSTESCLVPGGDTDNQIAFTISHDSSVILRFFNMDTQDLVRLIITEQLPAGTHTVEWDGKTQTGLFAAPGPYRCDITATAPDGNTSFIRRVLIFVAY